VLTITGFAGPRHNEYMLGSTRQPILFSNNPDRIAVCGLQ